MELTRLPFDAGVAEYRGQTEALLDAWRASDPDAIRLVRHPHPRFLNPEVPWLPRNVPDEEIRSASLDMAEAQLAVARWYDFGSWERLSEYIEAVTTAGSAVARFESAVEAVINGNLATLSSVLREDPALVQA